MLQQYFDMKEQHPEALIAMRVGDFYEFYGPDAEAAAAALDISLTGREDGAYGRIPMAGVPHHSVEKYLARLLSQGIKVALCDQLEDPKLAKKLVKRGVTRVLTPGTLLDDSMLEGDSSSWLGSVAGGKDSFGFAFLDAGSGDFAGVELKGPEARTLLAQELARVRPAELLISPDLDFVQETARSLSSSISVKPLPSQDRAERLMTSQLGVASLAGFGLEEKSPVALAAGAILQYAQDVRLNLNHIRSFQVYSVDGAMKIDPAARRSLELTQSLSGSRNDQTLLKSLDMTLTPMGKRMLSRWIGQPLMDRREIEGRHDAVQRLAGHPAARAALRGCLKGLGDLERPVSRCSAETATPADLAAVRRILLTLPRLDDPLRVVGLGKIQEIREEIGSHVDLTTKLRRALAENPPVHIREGGIIREGYDEELDRTRRLSRDAKEFMAGLETKEREATGINAVKIGFNNVFGYYLEVPKRFVAEVPSHYIRKQTTANAERYVTADLKEQEAIVLSAGERSLARETELFQELRAEIALHAEELLRAAKAIGEADVLASFAETAVQRDYTRPEIVDEDVLEIEMGRHPVVELQTNSFVPNSLALGSLDSGSGESSARLIVLTGPNMAGKSTYLRQVALTVIMAQAGSFVPAQKCRMGLCDRIFARIGARDDLAQGQSTFMVEMLEAASILNGASSQSLVILDEIGRGTATYDGLAIAWAIVENLAAVGCKTLFATHYHQLNELAQQAAVVRNFRADVREDGENIVWTHKVAAGGADRSYGIHVARMAGIPADVLDRASEILSDLEGSEQAGPSRIPQSRRLQWTLFEMEDNPIVKALQAVDINRLTPMEALALVDRLKRQYGSSTEN